jgi:hypothetical protein
MTNLSKCIKPLGLAMLASLVAACETPQDIVARQAQFDGKTFNEVVAVIGNPKQKTSQSAVWNYKETHTNLTPVYRYDQHGRAILVGHNRNDVTLTCTYTANLKSGRVTSSTYDGNGCKKYAPKLTS